MTDPTAREPIEAMVDRYGNAVCARINEGEYGIDDRARESSDRALDESRAALLAAIEALRRDAERWNTQQEHRQSLYGPLHWQRYVDYIDGKIEAKHLLSREAPHG